MVKRVARKIATLPALPIGMALPEPIDRHLDVLWVTARRAGQPTSRREIVAALILASPRSPEALVDLLSRYRDADVRDAAGESSASAGPKKPGRRTLEDDVT